MNEDVSRRRRLYLVGVAIVSVAAIWRAVYLVRTGSPSGVVILVAIAVIALIVVVTLVLQVRRMRGVARRVAQARPGAAVVPALAAAELRTVAEALHVSVRGLGGVGGTPVALASLPDRIEVWVGRDAAPRWALPRDAVREVGVQPAGYGASQVDAVWVGARTGRLWNGPDTAAVVLPAYRPLRAMFGGRVGDDLGRAVAALTEQPR
ncbi:hypothetical protein ACFT5B_05810 [Luteimicrobium sp. NPDC057192]|uniref:hypothetical protein n=1 Tax=Luteimicrobium sp. NPDC057192 TaxID=3346042 RepID=UPI00363BFC29